MDTKWSGVFLVNFVRLQGLKEETPRSNDWIDSELKLTRNLHKQVKPAKRSVIRRPLRHIGGARQRSLPRPMERDGTLADAILHDSVPLGMAIFEHSAFRKCSFATSLQSWTLKGGFCNIGTFGARCWEGMLGTIPAAVRPFRNQPMDSQSWFLQ